MDKRTALKLKPLDVVLYYPGPMRVKGRYLPWGESAFCIGSVIRVTPKGGVLVRLIATLANDNPYRWDGPEVWTCYSHIADWHRPTIDELLHGHKRTWYR